jgi:cobyrinic acid a,c-diamide synthase
MSMPQSHGAPPQAGLPGFIVAAPHSGAGKSTVTLGILAALRRRGRVPQPFKAGPDYIDPGHHERAAGRRCCNLDTWAMPAEAIGGLIARASAGADIAVAEGVMGLFDGVDDDGKSGRGSTADLAALTGWPVVLVLDVQAQTETAAAVAAGCAGYRADVPVAGVILNRVAGARHAGLILPAFERLGIEVVGVVPRHAALEMAERHLGLVQAAEMATSHGLETLADVFSEALDLDALVALAKAPSLTAKGESDGATALPDPPGSRIAVARDVAFSFAYNHLLLAWRARSAAILPFSPLADEPPDASADAVFLPGGYPELHAGRIAGAHRFKQGLVHLARKSVPIHGECGGYMVLGEGLVDKDGARHEMVGLLKAETSFARPQMHLGYREVRLLRDCALGSRGAAWAGHEFHFASLIEDRGPPLFDCRDAGQQARRETGSQIGSVTGSFVHLIWR